MKIVRPGIEADENLNRDFKFGHIYEPINAKHNVDLYFCHVGLSGPGLTALVTGNEWHKVENLEATEWRDVTDDYAVVHNGCKQIPQHVVHHAMYVAEARIENGMDVEEAFVQMAEDIEKRITED